ncbi:MULTISPECIES: ABC transporter permease [unclassified Clostridium]|uniref:ABC transporter permease n=1 Tax=unclassified Clostridium TaxID=2614128 RepID=UPI0025BCAA9D|nr:ABC transporter permease [Clostridium sp.]MDY4254061.1 ABC transporter permease [Clostridium sp.]
MRSLKVKLVRSNLVKYELRNLLGNIFMLIFGLIFPIFMSIFLGNLIGAQVPSETKDTVVTTIFISNSLMLPLATVFIGYSATFSQELEKNIPLRFRLFGYSEKTLVLSKIVAYLIFMTVAMVIYTIVVSLGLRILVPSFASVIILIGSLYLLSIIFFVLAHGIALFIKKFGPTYAITMILYFLIMILSGMFGVQAKDFPEPLMKIAYLFPTTYISSEFADFWQGGSYNFMPYIQSLILFIAVSAIVLFLAINKDSRYNHREKVSAAK